MAKVVIQLINDIGEVESESAVISDATVGEAQRVMAAAVDAAAGLRSQSRIGYVTEFHYGDGDVGAYDDLDVSKLLTYFTKSHAPSHIVIRPDTDQGQQLSNNLTGVLKMAAALNVMVDTINATGGVILDGSGFAPAADEEWLDLGVAYSLACEALGMTPILATAT